MYYGITVQSGSDKSPMINHASKLSATYKIYSSSTTTTTKKTYTRLLYTFENKIVEFKFQLLDECNNCVFECEKKKINVWRDIRFIRFTLLSYNNSIVKTLRIFV